MALFGTGRRNPFGLPDDLYRTPGIGDVNCERFGIDAPTQGAVDVYASLPQQQPQKRNWGQSLSDIGAGLMAAQAGIDGDFATSAQLSRSIGAAQRLAQAAQLKRQQEREDYLWQQQNKAPTPNDTERDYAFMSSTVGKEAADDWLRRRGDPMVNMTLPNGQFYSGPQSGLGAALGAQQNAPPRPVGKLTPIVGGAGGNASGGFPRYR